MFPLSCIYLIEVECKFSKAQSKKDDKSSIYLIEVECKYQYARTAGHSARVFI